MNYYKMRQIFHAASLAIPYLASAYLVFLQFLIVCGTCVQCIVLEIRFLDIVEEDGSLQNYTLFGPKMSRLGRRKMSRMTRRIGFVLKKELEEDNGIKEEGRFSLEEMDENIDMENGGGARRNEPENYVGWRKIKMAN